jgi:hypothetical protein
MIISRTTYDHMREDTIKAQVEARVLSEQNRALQTTIDWLRVRVNQVEKERAQLLFNYTGVKIETPSIEAAPPSGHPLNQVPHFNDVGDKEAARLGITWNPDGTLHYADQ